MNRQMLLIIASFIVPMLSAPSSPGVCTFRDKRGCPAELASPPVMLQKASWLTAIRTDLSHASAADLPPPPSPSPSPSLSPSPSPSAKNVSVPSGVSGRCSIVSHAWATSNVSDTCPTECPLRALSPGRWVSDSCRFACVAATGTSCQTFNSKEPIPDLSHGVCRACALGGCETCAEGSEDKCMKCRLGFQLLEDGSCRGSYFFVWMILFGFLLKVTIAVFFWVLDLCRRAVTNEQGLELGRATRSRAKLRMPKEVDKPDSSRQLWPLDTNMRMTLVAGPGMALQFNFMAMLIVWAATIAVSWLLFAHAIDPILLVLGTVRSSTMWQTCVVLAMGHETQHRLMWTKVAFVVFCYVFSFAVFVGFSAYQLRLFNELNEQNTTHMDFCAKLRGLPRILGTERVEEELQAAVERETGQRPVGVSVCWDTAEANELFEKVLQRRYDETTMVAGGAASSNERHAPSEQPGCLHRLFERIEGYFLTPTVQKLITKGRRRDFHHGHADTEETPEHAAVHEQLLRTATSDEAFVVFESQAARDEALTRSGGLRYREASLVLEEVKVEPGSVLWANMGVTSFYLKAKRLFVGTLAILAIIAIWTLFFYVPYVYFTMSFDYAQDQRPSIVGALTFTLVVVIGNAAVYFACSEVAHSIGYRTSGERELCYVLLYTVACTINIVLDLICAYKVAYFSMTKFPTYDGRLLADVTSFTDRFESYPMQKDLGQTLLAYAIPSTFILPFLFEPLATTYIPFALMSKIVASRPGVQGSRAEAFLAAPDMDLSRYADVLLNVFLAVLIFFFPGGFNLRMYVGLFLSHLYIYAYDTYRVLRSVPSFTYASSSVDWWAQWLLSFPCGILLSCIVFKANCEESLAGYHPQWLMKPCDHHYGLVAKCVAAFAIHVAVHTLILLLIVPLCARLDKNVSTESYRTCAERLPCSWFSVNPVHCLRSEHIYQHDPHWDFHVRGKEHLMRQNHAIGAYFSERAASAEDYGGQQAAVLLERLLTPHLCAFVPVEEAKT